MSVQCCHHHCPPFRPVPSLGVSPSAAVPLGTGTGQRPWLLAVLENSYYRPVSFNSIPLSEVSPFRGRRPSATSRRFPPALSVTLLYSPLHPGGSVQTIHDVNNCGVILHNGCACVPRLARPPSPAVLTTEPSSGTEGGPWVRDSFTNWHASGQITLHNILCYHYKNMGLVGHGVIKCVD